MVPEQSVEEREEPFDGEQSYHSQAMERQLQDAKEFIKSILKNGSRVYPIDIPVRNPGRAQHRINILRSLMIRQQISSPQEGPWELLSTDLQMDRDIAIEALVFQKVEYDNVPEQWRRDRTFLVEATSRNSRLWFVLPEEFQEDSTFFQELLSSDSFKFLTDDMIAAVFDKHPHLRYDVRVWTKIISTFVVDRKAENEKRLLSQDGPLFCSLLYAPPCIRANKELMLEACKGAATELLKINKDLANDHIFLRQVLSSQPLGLLFAPENVLASHPDLVMDNLKPFLQTSSSCAYQSKLARRLGSTFFYEGNLDLAKIWFLNGGRFSTLSEVFTTIPWTGNAECLLWTATYGASLLQHNSYERRSYGEKEFAFLSDELKDDLEFMMRVAEKVDWPLIHGSVNVKKSMPLIVRALSHSEEDVQNYWRTFRSVEGQEWTDSLFGWLEESLDRMECVFDLVLSCPHQGSFLGRLMLDPETTSFFIWRIFGFAGLPDSPQEYNVYESAYQNMRGSHSWRLVVS